VAGASQVEILPSKVGVFDFRQWITGVLLLRDDCSTQEEQQTGYG
jgi:hypothetical protein